MFQFLTKQAYLLSPCRSTSLRQSQSHSVYSTRCGDMAFVGAEKSSWRSTRKRRHCSLPGHTSHRSRTWHRSKDATGLACTQSHFPLSACCSSGCLVVTCTQEYSFVGCSFDKEDPECIFACIHQLQSLHWLGKPLWLTSLHLASKHYYHISYNPRKTIHWIASTK